MRRTGLIAIAMAVFMLTMPLSIVVSAHEVEGEPIVITVPTETMDCAVFFADNMVYAPQWRIGNPVRIETMIINMDDVDDVAYAEPEDILTNDTDLIDLYNKEVEDPDTGEILTVYDGLKQQAAINANSDEILPLTRMVSVSYIKMTMTNDSGFETSFDAGWNSTPDDDPTTDDYEQVIFGGIDREVNKGGHLIYAMLWDTTDLEVGTYTVSVELGYAVETSVGSGVWTGIPSTGATDDWYSVDYAIAHHYGSEGVLANPYHPYVDIVSDPEDPWYADLGIGLGGVENRAAWIELGDLMPQGSGGGNGDESDGNNGEIGGGNGDHEHGQTGSAYGRKK
jgi:hypothetical protein